MKNILNFLAVISVFLALPVFGQTANLKVNPNTGAIVGDAPTAANFKSANLLASASAGILTSSTVSISIKGLEGSVWQFGPAANDRVETPIIYIPDERGIYWMKQNGVVGADLVFNSVHQTYLTSGSGELKLNVPAFAWYVNRFQLGGAGSADNDQRFMYLRGADASSTGTTRNSYGLGFQSSTWVSGSNVAQIFGIQSVPIAGGTTTSRLTFIPNAAAATGTNALTGTAKMYVDETGVALTNGAILTFADNTTQSTAATAGITYVAGNIGISISGSSISATGSNTNFMMTTGTLNTTGTFDTYIRNQGFPVLTAGTTSNTTGVGILIGGTAGMGTFNSRGVLFEINIPQSGINTNDSGDFYIDNNHAVFVGRKSVTAGGGTQKFVVQDRSGGAILTVTPASALTSLSGSLAIADNAVFTAAGKTISLKGGANALSGTGKMTSGTLWIVSSAVSASTPIYANPIGGTGTTFSSDVNIVLYSGSAAVIGSGADDYTYIWGGIKANQ